MINYSTKKLPHKDSNYKHMDTSRNRDQRNLPLLGKAVLLIGNDTAVVHRLIKQLVQEGADVALLCGRLPAETAQHLQAQVQASGNHLLLVQQADNESQSLGQLVHHIATRWGPIDFFIDLSARQSSAPLPENGNDSKAEGKVEKAEPLANLRPWQVTQVILEEMTQA